MAVLNSGVSGGRKRGISFHATNCWRHGVGPECVNGFGIKLAVAFKPGERISAGNNFTGPFKYRPLAKSEQVSAECANTQRDAAGERDGSLHCRFLPALLFLLRSPTSLVARFEM